MSAASDYALYKAKAAGQAMVDALAAASWLDTGEPISEARRLRLIAEADKYRGDIERAWSEWTALAAPDGANVVAFPGRPGVG
jgi:hypothetical protein